jgi:ArsR family transcriptional regulator, arsenate/arsenite/antimonite-responsive transcriptional repressor
MRNKSATLPMLQRPAECCPAIAAVPISDGDAAVTSALFKALSDPHRVKIVNLLATSDEAVCVCDVTAAIGLSQPTTSFHLKKLVTAGLIDREQRGVWGYYSLNRRALRQLSGVFDTKENVR